MGKEYKIALRPTIKGLKQAVKEYQDGYEAARSDFAALQKRNTELLEMRDEAKRNAESWLKYAGEMKERAIRLEKDNANLEKDRDAYRYNFEAARENLNRCLGWIDSRLDTHPVERYRRREDGAMPEETEMTRAEQNRANTGDFTKPYRDKW